MPDFRVSDTAAFDEKLIAAGNAAVGLWTRAGAWSMLQLTDGFVPSAIVSQIGRRREAMRLVDAGLWREVDGGFEFVKFLKHQRSRAQIEGDRGAARDRMKRVRSGRSSREHEEALNGVLDQGATKVRPNSDQTLTEVDLSIGRGSADEQTPDLDERSAVRANFERSADEVRDSLPFPSHIGVGRPGTTANQRTSEPFPNRCPAHAFDEFPPACGACRDVRLTAEADERAARDRAAERRQAEIEADKRVVLGAIADCGLCDARGYRAGRVCDHDPDVEERARRGIAAARQAIGST